MRAEAVRLARRDLGDRQDPGALETLGWALYRSGDVEMAWTLTQEALEAGAAPPPISSSGEKDFSRFPWHY